MKELEQKPETKIEVSVNKKKQVEHQLIGDITPHEGHTLWEINEETLDVKEAKFSNVSYYFGGENKKEVITKNGHSYISALNKKNALKKFTKGKNGSKPIEKEPLSLYNKQHGEI